MSEEFQLIWVILSLLLVIGIIFAMAVVAKRFLGVSSGGQQHIRVLSVTNLSHKEKLALVEVAGQQLLLGVTPQNINLLHSLEQPIHSNNNETSAFAKKLTSLMRKNSNVEAMAKTDPTANPNST